MLQIFRYWASCMQPRPKPNLHWYPFTIAKNIWPKLAQASSQNELQFIFTADGWMTYPFNLPLSAPACCWVPFRWLLPCDFCQLCHSFQSYHNQIFQVQHQILTREINVKSFILDLYMHNDTKIYLRLNRNQNEQRWIGKWYHVSPEITRKECPAKLGVT